MPTFIYSTKSKRYHDPDGKFISRLQVRAELDTVINHSSQRMSDWTRELQNAEVSIADWQGVMAQEIKDIHSAFAAVAHGGFDRTEPEVWDRVEDYIFSQYEYLNRFAEQFYTGEQPPNPAMLYRATLYAESARTTYEQERRIIEKDSGATEERNILGGSDHCNGCVDATLQGWVPIDTLVPVGLRECGPKCHCVIIFRTGPNDKRGSDTNS